MIVEICFNKIYLVEETNNCLAVSSRLVTDRGLLLVSYVLIIVNRKVLKLQKAITLLVTLLVRMERGFIGKGQPPISSISQPKIFPTCGNLKATLITAIIK